MQVCNRLIHRGFDLQPIFIRRFTGACACAATTGHTFSHLMMHGTLFTLLFTTVLSRESKRRLCLGDSAVSDMVEPSVALKSHANVFGV